MSSSRSKKNAIALHALEDRTPGGIEVRYVDQTSNPDNKRVITPHRDDHYLFVLQESGRSRIFVDFEEVLIRDRAIMCILPGQVHYYISMRKVRGWLLSVAPLLVGSEPTTIFQEQFDVNEPLALDGPAADGILACVRLLQHQLSLQPLSGGRSIPLLTGAFAEMAAAGYADRQIRNSNDRPQAAKITSRFRALVVQNFREQKSPITYAKALNYSLAHLNDSVKYVTGMPVSHWIQNQVLLESRRLLYHSDLSIKEIASSLGYENPAYFTRLFTEKTGISPLAFRKKIRE